MEIILIKDVPNLGFKDDVLSVKNGYGRNYLIPQGFAALATSSAIKQLEETLKQRAYKEKKIVDAATKIANSLKTMEVKISAKAGKGSVKLFGSVTNANLAEEIAKLGQDVEKKFISIRGGVVKATGKYVADIRLHRSVVVPFEFEVVAAAAK